MARKQKEEKKKDKKKAHEGLRSKGPPDPRSEDTLAPSHLEGEEEEGGEAIVSSDTKKRVMSKDVQGDPAPSALKKQCRASVALFDDVLDSDEESRKFERVRSEERRVGKEC